MKKLRKFLLPRRENKRLKAENAALKLQLNYTEAQRLLNYKLLSNADIEIKQLSGSLDKCKLHYSSTLDDLESVSAELSAAKSKISAQEGRLSFYGIPEDAAV